MRIRTVPWPRSTSTRLPAVLLHPDGVDLDREDATGPARELRCENAVTGSDLEHKVAASDLRLPDELGGRWRD